MNTRDTPLVDIFFPKGTGIPDSVITSRVSPLPRLEMAFPNLGKDILGAVQKDVKASTNKMLQMRPLDILEEGWKRYKEVLDALSDSKKNPTDPILKPLIRHTIKSIHHPYLQLCLDENPVWKLEFEITASLEVQGVLMKIHNGTITDILSGACQGKFKLVCLDQLLAETKSIKFNLPGEISMRTAIVQDQPVSAQTARLTGIGGELTGEVFNLMDNLVIGRSSSSSIRLHDSTVSRHHARLRCAVNRWYVQDMESAIGTYVNGKRVDAIALNDGDRIRIGKAEFEFRE